jgi:hypothetical protein
MLMFMDFCWPAFVLLCGCGGVGTIHLIASIEPFPAESIFVFLKEAQRNKNEAGHEYLPQPGRRVDSTPPQHFRRFFDSAANDR